jgi:hypothetical protein
VALSQLTREYCWRLHSPYSIRTSVMAATIPAMLAGDSDGKLKRASIKIRRSAISDWQKFLTLVFRLSRCRHALEILPATLAVQSILVQTLPAPLLALLLPGIFSAAQFPPAHWAGPKKFQLRHPTPTKDICMQLSLLRLFSSVTLPPICPFGNILWQCLFPFFLRT